MVNCLNQKPLRLLFLMICQSFINALFLRAVEPRHYRFRRHIYGTAPFRMACFLKK